MLTKLCYQNYLQSALKAAKKKAVAITAILLISFSSVYSQTANILIEPTPVNITPGQSFSVDVHVDMISGTANAVGVHLLFNATNLQITNITRPSSALFSFESVPLPAAPYTTANSTGHLVYEAGIPAGNTSSDFDILTITFTTATPAVIGSSTLTLENSPGHRTRVVQTGVPLTGTLTNGTVNVTNCTTPTAVIASNTGSAICNGQDVTIRLQSATGVSPYDLTINGSTYNDITVGSNIVTVPFPTYRVFPSDPLPTTGTQNDASPVNLGMKFRSSEGGFIRGIRFYRNAVGGGTYIMKLREYGGASTLLATVTVGAVPLASWQDVLFPTPVAITANTVYVAILYSSSGNYVAESNYITSDFTNGPLTVTADNGGGPAGANSVYFYGTSAAADNTFTSGDGFDDWSSFQSSFYFMDPLFTSNTNTFNLTEIVDGNACPSVGSPNLQTLVVTSMDCATLPVTLLNLSATPEGNKAIIRWTTTQEINNRGFHIERSTDNSSWAAVGFVSGVGNTDNPTNYSYTDLNLESRRYFYRLKQVDFDDRFKYSATVSAVIGSRAEYSLGQNYPNPFSDQTTIQYVLPQRENVLLTLHDANGKLVKVLVNGSKDSGTHATNVYSGNLSRGVYYYKIIAGEFMKMKKMVIQ